MNPDVREAVRRDEMRFWSAVLLGAVGGGAFTALVVSGALLLLVRL